MEAFPKPQAKPLLLLISGPAGCGKTTLFDRLMQDQPDNLARVVTSTTRAPRKGERHGVDYYFFSREAFEEKLSGDEFYEHATIHGNLYGILRTEVSERLAGKRDVLLNIDVQGAAAIREAAKHDTVIGERLVSIFVMPPHLDVLRQRMKARGKDSPEVIERRLLTALEEIPQWRFYDYVITTSERETDFAALKSIYIAEKLSVRK